MPFPALDGLCFTDLSGLRLAGTLKEPPLPPLLIPNFL
jgi:hypothetical protein